MVEAWRRGERRRRERGAEMSDERTCRVQVLVDGHAVADCECLSCDVEVERGGSR